MGRIEKYLTIAAEEARNSDLNAKHGAVLVKGGHLIAKGHNGSRTRVEGRNYCSTHAEAAKITTRNKDAKKRARKRDGGKQVRGCDLFVVKLSGVDGSFGDSRPCHLCLSWMKRRGVRRVFYSTGLSGDFIWKMQTLDELLAEPRPYVTKGELFVQKERGVKIRV